MRELAHTIKLNDRESISSSTETWSEANWEEALQLTKLKPDRHGVDCGELRGYNLNQELDKCMPVERCVWLGSQQTSSLSGMERYKGDSCCQDYNERRHLKTLSVDCEPPDAGDRCRRQLR